MTGSRVDGAAPTVAAAGAGGPRGRRAGRPRGTLVVTRLAGDDRPSGAGRWPAHRRRHRSARRRPSPSRRRRAPDITGPLNLLLVGVDTRVSVPGWEPHARRRAGAARAEGAGPGVPLLAPPRPAGRHPGVPEGRLPRRQDQAHPRDELRQPGARQAQAAEHRPGVRAAAQHGQRLHRAAHSTPARCSPSTASTGWWTPSAGWTSTSTSGSSRCTAGPTASTGSPRRAAAATSGRRWSTRRASGTSTAGRRWTTPGSATSPAATTPGSATSSSSSRR